jgi:hypothetical protein
LADTGKTATGAYLVNLLLSNQDDLNILNDDTYVSSTAPYTSIKMSYFPSAFQRDVDTTGSNRSFGIVCDVGTHSGVDGSCSASGNTLTSAAGSITGSNYTGGTLTIYNGANKGTYTISGTPTSTVITITGTFPSTVSNQSFTLQRATPVSASLQQIYTKIQYLLRQNSDIDGTSGSVIGKTAGLLANFVGPTLVTGFYAPTNPNGGGSGVLVQGLAAADVNSIDLYDNSSVKRNYPYQAVGTINANSSLVGGSSYYRMFFTTLPGSTNDYGESGAVTVNDASGNPITGVLSSSSISFTFDYDGNVQGGRTPGTDAAVTVVAGNPNSAKPVVATGTLTRSKTISLTLVAETDRAYL